MKGRLDLSSASCYYCKKISPKKVFIWRGAITSIINLDGVLQFSIRCTSNDKSHWKKRPASTPTNLQQNFI